MSWLKHVLLDLAVTIAIVAYAFGGQPRWLWWAIAVYSGLMLLLKVAAAASPAATGLSNKSTRAVPVWFFHAVYAVSVLALLYAREYALAGVWAVIWLLSFVADARAKRPAAAAPKARGGKAAAPSARR